MNEDNNKPRRAEPQETGVAKKDDQQFKIALKIAELYTNHMTNNSKSMYSTEYSKQRQHRYHKIETDTNIKHSISGRH